MARVTGTEVEAIIELDSAIVVTPFIEAATQLIDAALLNKGIGAALLKEIERWLAAHFTAIRQKQTSSEAALSAKDAYQFKLGLNLEVTLYGQQAIALDFTGTLKGLTSGKSASLGVIDPITTITS